jgi:hypothetical protein
MRGMVLLRGRWWLVGAKLISEQIAAPVSEIMDDSSYVTRNTRKGSVYEPTHAKGI